MPVSRNIRLLAWFFFWVDFRLYAPIAILYFAQVSGSYALGMSVYSAAMLAQSFFEVPTGVFSDLIGRKRTVVCGAVAGVLSLICYALAGAVPGGSYAVLLIGGIFEGLGRAFYSGNNEALLHDTLAEMDRRGEFQEYLGRTSSMYQFALAVSAVIGSLIAAVSFQLVLWASVIAPTLALIVSLRLIEPRLIEPRVHSAAHTNVYAHLVTAYRKIVHNPRLRSLTAAGVLTYALGESAWLFRSAFVATLWPTWALGIAQMIANATAAVSFYFAGRLIKRFGEYRLLVGGMSISEAINLAMLLIPTVLSPALMALNSVFFGVNVVAQQGLMQREFSDDQRATMGSLTSFAGSITFALFSFLLGALADRVGVIPALVTAAALALIPMALYGRVLRPRAAVDSAAAPPLQA